MLAKNSEILVLQILSVQGSDLLDRVECSARGTHVPVPFEGDEVPGHNAHDVSS
jgi:hypothetical protein